ncbi:MAG: trigger factor [Methylocystis sp.]
MQVTQTLSEGLKQEFKVVLPASDLAAKLESQLAEVRAKAQIKGFRPGKAPIAHLKKLYGKSIMGEVLQEAVNDANRKIVEENKLRVASGPKLDLPEDRETIEKLLEAAGDFAFVVSFETLPSFEVGSFDDISLERPVAPVSDEEVEKAVNQFAERLREYEPRAEEGGKAEKGDKLTIDFEGKLDGVPFEGGTGGDVDLVLGSGMFIPGFEEQLQGAAKGEKRLVKTRFPDDYSAANLAGKDAEFDVTVKEVSAPKPLDIDDELAKKYGFESLEAMRAAVRANIEADFDKASRDKLKRKLLDALDKRYSFDLPQSLVEQEFQGIWREVEKERAKADSTEFEGKSEEELRADYRAIAERRVRLGLVLAEIGQSAGVTVEEKDLTEAVVERARQFPGQEKQIWDFYRNNEQALASLRAPIYEERVVAHLSSLVKIAEKTVTREELFAEDEEDAA